MNLASYGLEKGYEISKFSKILRRILFSIFMDYHAFHNVTSFCFDGMSSFEKHVRI